MDCDGLSLCEHRRNTIQLPELISLVRGEPKIIWQDIWSVCVGETRVIWDAPCEEVPVEHLVLGVLFPAMTSV